MCGIVGFVGRKQAAGILLNGLERLEYRGYDSAGIAVLNKDKFTINKTVKRIKTLIDSTDNGKNVQGTIGIGHTRWATHGAPTSFNAHPHLSDDFKFAVVHNGIIENYLELRAELEKDGIVFKSETDTEVVPQLLQKYYKGDFLDAVKKTVARLNGSYALGIICTDYPDTLIAAKQFSPLILGIGKEEKYIASDVTAVVSHTRDVIYIDDGEIAVLTPDTYAVYGKDGKEIEKPLNHIDWDVCAAEKGGWDHFMMKEIHEQPRAVQQTVESRIKDGRVDLELVNFNADILKNIRRICIVACGSAYHAGFVGKYVLEEMLRIPVDCDVASEFRYRRPIIDKNTLAIVISQSGETADTLAALREAKENGAHTLAIVNVVGSSIAKAADDVIYTWAGPEIAVATTKGYTTQLAVLYLLGIWCADILKTVPESELNIMLAAIRSLPEKIEEILTQNDKIKSLAKRCAGVQSLFFIGRNIDYAVALEASLKLKEISYIHSEAYAAGELKHGTISLIEDDRTVIALAGYEDLMDKLISNIKEVKARGAYVLACAVDGNTSIESVADETIYIPRTYPLFLASLEVIPFQLYAYYAALENHCDIDKPRNLAKSVTVE